MKNVWKRIAALVFALVLVVGLVPVTANAADHNGGTIYFRTNWTNPVVQLMIGNDHWSEGKVMTKVGDDLYRVEMGEWKNGQHFAVFGTNEHWGGEPNTIAHRKNWAPISTGVDSSNLQFETGKEYWIFSDGPDDIRVEVKCNLYVENVPFGTLSTDKLGVVLSGETVTVTATPDSGCKVGSVTVNGNALIPVDGVYKFTMPKKDTTVSATFVPEVKWGSSASNLTGGGSFADAINAANSSADVAYIQLQDNVTFTSDSKPNLTAKNSNLVIDWNGKNFSTTTGITLKSKLTLKDTAATPGKVKITENGCSLVTLWSGGELEILSGDYLVDCSSGSIMTVGTPSDTVTCTIRGGSFAGGSSIMGCSNGNLIIEGGNFKSGSWYGIGTSGGKTIIRGGTFTGSKPALGYTSGQIEFTDNFPENITLVGWNNDTTDVSTAVKVPDGYGLLLDGERATEIEANKVYTVGKVSYRIVCEPSENGTVTAPATAKMGEKVTLTVTPDEDYEVERITANAKTVTDVSGAYEFEMPAEEVVVSATFKKHVHNWGYAVSQSGVTAICSCGATEAVWLTAPDVANGEFEATLSDDNGGAAPATVGDYTVGAIKYYNDEDQELTAAPTNAGEYTAKVLVTGDTNEYTIWVNYEIVKEQPTVPTGLVAYYSNTLADVILPDGWTWDAPTTDVGNVGTKTFKASFAENSTTKGATGVDVTVEVEHSAVEVTVTTDKTEYTYGDIVKLTIVRTPTGKPATNPVSVDEDLKNAIVVAEYYTEEFYVDVNDLPYYAPGGVTVEVDTAKYKIAPGELTWGVLIGPDGNVELGMEIFNIKLNKAELEVTAPTATEITYGQTLADSTLNGGAASGVDGDPVAVHFAWKDASVAPEVADSLTTEYDVTVTPQDGTYYKSAEVKVKVKVNKAQQEVPVLTPVNETVETKADGKIIGLTTEMEIATKANAADSEYTKVTDPDMTFAPGTYYVRYYETDNYLPSAVTTVEIGEGLNVGITWIIDGEEDYEDLAPGDAITAPADPTKEGHTFLGWEGDEIPATIPAEDITITLKSTWEKNSYKLTWVIDGETTEETVPYGDSIKAPANPTKEGYKFLGWEGDEIPATMPAKDITITLKSVWEKLPVQEDNKNDDPNVPVTADPSQMVLWTVLCITSMLGMAVMLMMFPRKKGKYEVE